MRRVGGRSAGASRAALDAACVVLLVGSCLLIARYFDRPPGSGAVSAAPTVADVARRLEPSRPAAGRQGEQAPRPREAPTTPPAIPAAASPVVARAPASAAATPAGPIIERRRVVEPPPSARPAPSREAVAPLASSESRSAFEPRAGAAPERGPAAPRQADALPDLGATVNTLYGVVAR